MPTTTATTPDIAQLLATAVQIKVAPTVVYPDDIAARDETDFDSDEFVPNSFPTIRHSHGEDRFTITLKADETYIAYDGDPWLFTGVSYFPQREDTEYLHDDFWDAEVRLENQRDPDAWPTTEAGEPANFRLREFADRLNNGSITPTTSPD